MLYSYTNFWDVFTILLTLAMGVYTTGLFVQTVWYVFNQSSLVGNMKV